MAVVVFDGGVCDLFALVPARTVAFALGRLIRRVSGDPDTVPYGIEDPYQALALAQRYDLAVRTRVERGLAEAEEVAARSAVPLPGALLTSGDVVIAVQAESAVRAYLDLHGLTAGAVHARTGPDPVDLAGLLD